jgi:soluble lytic murein transglycosylase
MLYPRPHEKEILAAAQRFGMDPHLLWAVMRQESAFDPNATSYVGAMGLMQLMPATAKGEAKKLGMEVGNAYKPEINILLGAAHLSMNLKRFDAVEHAVAAYNAGGGAVKRWLENGRDLREWAESIPYEETNGYVRKVMANYFMYRLLYAESVPLSGENGEPLSGDETPEAPSEVKGQEFVEEDPTQE